MEFRKMRRYKQALSGEECERILSEAQTGVLGLIGYGGYPYTVPLNFVYRGGKIYFHCAKTGHKIDAIKANDKVSFCVIDRDEVVPERLATDYKSVIAFGRARILSSDEEIFNAAELFGLKYSDDKAAVDNEIKREWNALSCVEITVEHIAGKQAAALVKN